MVRFTIRDVLWLMVVAGLAIGWWLHATSLKLDQARREETITADYQQSLRRHGEGLDKYFQGQGKRPANPTLYGLPAQQQGLSQIGFAQ
jgi:hypothetical protein